MLPETKRPPNMVAFPEKKKEREQDFLDKAILFRMRYNQQDTIYDKLRSPVFLHLYLRSRAQAWTRWLRNSELLLHKVTSKLTWCKIF